MGKKSGKSSSNKRESNGRGVPDDDQDDFMSTALGDDPEYNAAQGVIDDDLQSRIDEMNTILTKSSTFDLGEAVDMLIEKKVNMREPGLTSIINHLQSSGRSSAEFDNLMDYLEVLITRLARMIRRPASSKEGILVCSVFNLLALYTGPHDQTLLQAVEKPLVQLIDRSDDETAGINELRCSALFTYSFLMYMYENEESLVETLDYLQQILLGESSEEHHEHGGVVTYTLEMKAKAIECWVLLASHLPEHEVLERAREGEVFETITNLLDNATNDINMKVSAGRAIAFLWETAHSSDDQVSFEQLGHLLCDNPRIVDEALNVIQKMSGESSKKVSKKIKKEQRAEFRDIESWIFHQEYPIERIKMQGAEIEVDSFAKSRIVETLRQVLESGFHSALRMYPVVKDILEVDFVTDDMDGTATTVKVGKGSSADKLRTKNMKQDRRYRDAYVNSEGYDD